MLAAFEVKQSQHPPFLAISWPRSTQVPVNIPDIQVEQQKWNPEVSSFFFFFFKGRKPIYCIYSIEAHD